MTPAQRHRLMQLADAIRDIAKPNPAAAAAAARRRGSVTRPRPAFELRHDADGELDEVLAAWPAFVHVEVMDHTHIWMGITLEDRTLLDCNFYLEGPDALLEHDVEDPASKPTVRLRYRAELDCGGLDGASVVFDEVRLVGRMAQLLADMVPRLPKSDPMRLHAEDLLSEFGSADS